MLHLKTVWTQDLNDKWKHRGTETQRKKEKKLEFDRFQIDLVDQKNFLSVSLCFPFF